MAHIAWLIPTLIIGSGGHRTILQCAHALETEGHTCYLYLESQSRSLTSSAVNELYQALGYKFTHVYYGWHSITEPDLAIATVWYSAQHVRDLPYQCIKAYFVQDWEASFNPVGDTYIKAENSYTYGLIPITIGRWLQKRLHDQFAINSFYTNFGADLQIYANKPSTERSKSICFIYQPDKPRRCTQLGLETLDIVKYHHPDTDIILYGSSHQPPKIYKERFQWLGLLDIHQCSELYSRSSIGLCISASNPSRIPFEMMACGLPVVDLFASNTIYDFPSTAMLLGRPNPEALASKLIFLLENPTERHMLGQSGVNFMQNYSLSDETKQFCDAVSAILQGFQPPEAMISPLYDKPLLAPNSITHRLPSALIPTYRASKLRSFIRRLIPSQLRYFVVRCISKFAGINL